MVKLVYFAREGSAAVNQHKKEAKITRVIVFIRYRIINYSII